MDNSSARRHLWHIWKPLLGPDLIFKLFVQRWQTVIFPKDLKYKSDVLCHCVVYRLIIYKFLKLNSDAAFFCLGVVTEIMSAALTAKPNLINVLCYSRRTSIIYCSIFIMFEMLWQTNGNP